MHQGFGGLPAGGMSPARGSPPPVHRPLPGSPLGSSAAASEAVRAALRRSGASDRDACLRALDAVCADADRASLRARQAEGALRELEIQIAAERARRAEAEGHCARLTAQVRDLQQAAQGAASEARGARELQAAAEAEAARAHGDAADSRAREEREARRRLNEAEAVLAQKSLLADERQSHAQQLRRSEADAEQLRLLLRESERLLERRSQELGAQAQAERALRERAAEEQGALRERVEALQHQLARREAEARAAGEGMAEAKLERDRSERELERVRGELTQLQLQVAAADTRRADQLLSASPPRLGLGPSLVSPRRVGDAAPAAAPAQAPPSPEVGALRDALAQCQRERDEARKERDTMRQERDAALRSSSDAGGSQKRAQQQQEAVMRVPRVPGSILGIELDDGMVLLRASPGSAAARHGVGCYVGWRLVRVNGAAVFTQGGVARAIAARALDTELVFSPPPPLPSVPSGITPPAGGSEVATDHTTLGDESCRGRSPVPSPYGSPIAAYSPQLATRTSGSRAAPAARRTLSSGQRRQTAHAQIDPLASPKGLVPRQATPMPAHPIGALTPDAVSDPGGQQSGSAAIPPPALRQVGTPVAFSTASTTGSTCGATAPTNEHALSPVPSPGPSPRASHAAAAPPGAGGERHAHVDPAAHPRGLVPRVATPLPTARHAQVDPIASPRGCTQRVATPAAYGPASPEYEFSPASAGSPVAGIGVPLMRPVSSAEVSTACQSPEHATPIPECDSIPAAHAPSPLMEGDSIQALPPQSPECLSVPSPVPPLVSGTPPDGAPHPLPEHA
eukprot:TRINITY_DN7424_c0_g2_i6.p1 TRINITY_DN7424_c0_g2~~TRINITY_DN7424_c0_g2_i6.p1  ORF type:complete len:802 (+),score=174.09 TRINITY_DN7424_c0_g2_i6:78-2483(+)